MQQTNQTGLSVFRKLIIEACASSAKRYVQIKQLKLLCFQKSKQTSIRKISNFTGNWDHINKE